jgi:DNA polymerase III subunit epsilon
MREIILDTETTGLDPRDGHRIVEIACVEIINLVPTGQNYHVYINPQRDMPDEAFRVHGLSSAFYQISHYLLRLCKIFYHLSKTRHL